MLRNPGGASAAARTCIACAAIALAACAGDRRERTVLSLTEELPSAELRCPEDRIDLGTPAAEPHLVSGWSFAETYGGGDGTFAWSYGPVSVLTFREAEAGPLRLILACFPMEAPGREPQTVAVAVNGSEVATVRPVPGGGEVAVDVPASAVRAGDNRLELRYGFTVIPRDALAGSTDPRPLAVGWDAIRFERPSGPAPSPPSASADGGALQLPGGTAVTYYARVPANARLALGSVRGKGELVVRVAGADGRAARETVARAKRGGHVDLTGDRPEILAITLESRGRDGLTVRDPEVRAPATGAEAAGGAGAAPEGPSPGASPNVILYVVDTLRRDALGCYGNPQAFTPHVDAFARAGVQFRTASAQSPWTRPSTASILTGLQPQVHAVQRGEDALPEEVETLAEMLGAAGYRCGAFVSNPNVAPALRFGQGFRDFAFRPYPEPGSSADALGREVADWLPDGPGGTPFLAWIHPMDPHAPYAPPEGFRGRFHPDPVPPGFGTVRRIEEYVSGAVAVPPGAAQRMRALYRGEVARVDRAFGRLLRELAVRDLARSTVVVFVSDHGEEFQEHGGWEHARTLYHEVGDVPLVIGGSVRRGEEGVAGRADQVDVVPTLLELAGIRRPDLSGVALLQPGRRAADRPSLQSNRLDGCTGDAITVGHWKLIRLPEAGRNVRLFDLAADPGEHRDLGEARPVMTGYLTRLLVREQAALPPPVGHAEGELDPEALARLQALGYAGS